MARIVHVSVRSRYRLLLLSAVIAFIYTYEPHILHDGGARGDGDHFSIIPTSAINWSSQLRSNTNHPLPPLKGNKPPGIYKTPSPPGPPVSSSPQESKKHKTKKPPSSTPDKKNDPNSGPGHKNQPPPELSRVASNKAAKIQIPQHVLEREFFSWSPVPDPFPLLSRNPPPDPSLLQAPKANRAPPRKWRHYNRATPLLIGFTRNWPQLLQCVVSYIAAGWPPEEIHIIENTGVMYANRDGMMTLQNPFYLNHTQLAMLGVDVIVTPTLLTFAQLQNFYAWTALSQNWTEYFCPERDKDQSTLYTRAAGLLRYLRHPTAPRWAHHFFAYDHLTLVNRDAILAVGGWDTHIPYYASDCDMYARLMWAGYWQGESEIGIIYDVATVLDDVGALLRIPGSHAAFPDDPGPSEESYPSSSILNSMGGGGDGDSNNAHQQKPDPNPAPAPNGMDYIRQKLHEVELDSQRRARVDRRGETWAHLVEVGLRMEEAKYAEDGGGRNTWQVRQSGGQGEPFARDAEGFEAGVQMMIDTGRAVFADKWGHRGCDVARMGVKGEDAWRLERDWDVETEGYGWEGGEW
ncbi:hypothetical protein B0T17DRAFT_611366 [Bombardia bombarda]|uniref:Uncharacterized protein n=1 Tax=Bombardia bombarda TaxID=252184 RepID=A0AA40CED5_9PEZI|nr:hypothetical protein B0T17DRAFT_611366 [Bombardia bombarda]